MLRDLGQIASHGAASFREATALVCARRSFTFSEVDALACQLANGLAAMGVEPGDRVTLYAQNSWFCQPHIGLYRSYPDSALLAGV